MVFAQSQCRRLYTRWQCDVGQVHDLTQFNCSHINFDVVRNITWQTLNLYVGSLVLHHAASHLDTFTDIFIGEV